MYLFVEVLKKNDQFRNISTLFLAVFQDDVMPIENLDIMSSALFELPYLFLVTGVGQDYSPCVLEELG